MRSYSLISLIVLAILTAALPVFAEGAFPRMTTVAPDTGKAGDVLTVSGENLGKNIVSQLFLTDGKNDTKVEIAEQVATSIKFKIPASAKPGRFNLLVLTADKPPKLIEQPVKVTVQ